MGPPIPGVRTLLRGCANRCFNMAAQQYTPHLGAMVCVSERRRVTDNASDATERGGPDNAHSNLLLRLKAISSSPIDCSLRPSYLCADLPGRLGGHCRNYGTLVDPTPLRC